ncbi:bifunctional demethylmenaquinone methyltransferase/2-methoxy-6-polyprenyl-1,4-benzoquinol methylase UbiE [Spirosoma validum]|uniref:Demethylmenaquinone methyltransferase n=1 Tax=Spirosoma validum TaxID=2771355 RepID=A0A927B6R6_9BACT|nr:bifunctional demethylmenaquinone methyltransferase/2-methoxy-6-polyprenyl-1,4-benzoquinol methylase UbiE [Spirosoma validum]MBD2756303.1 bifunctional demethylmenaquinone methyltransferase/2-methoxy-6-polyprenyl-1,4-benzoquinol methylase UbiE [Spirosoma validum]
MAVVPYKDKNTSKREQVAEMFDNISPKYDLLNHLLSGGIDILWRKRAIRELRSSRIGGPKSPALSHKTILDIATGTGDFALEALALKPEKIVGVDISEGMLAIGREKMKKRGVDHIIEMRAGDSEGLPFADNEFDAVIVSFGVRNFENLLKGLTDMHRVTRPGGVCVVLEFSNPRQFPFKQLYGFYSRTILPLIGRMVSKDTSAYSYLPESVQAFPDGPDFLRIYEAAGFINTKWIPLTFGVASIYIGHKHL